MSSSRRAQRHQIITARLSFYFKLPERHKVAATRDKLTRALGLLDDKLTEAGATMSLWMIGGGCMMLHLDSRESSGDLDVIPRKGDFRALMRFVEEVAQEMREQGEPIADDWMNGDFSPQLMTLNISPNDFEADPRFHWKAMDIRFAKPELMLALKAFSFRPEGMDRQDLAALMDMAHVRDLDHFYDILEHYGDINMIQDGDDLLMENMFKEVRSRRS